MKTTKDKFHEALESGSLSDITKAIRQLAEEISYQLKPPYTEIARFTAKEERGKFSIAFSAKLYLHYSASMRSVPEGLIFEASFSGKALSDAPNPPIDELFQAAKVERLDVYGYGGRWKGEQIETPSVMKEKLEVPSEMLARIGLGAL